MYGFISYYICFSYVLSTGWACGICGTWLSYRALMVLVQNEFFEQFVCLSNASNLSYVAKYWICLWSWSPSVTQCSWLRFSFDVPSALLLMLMVYSFSVVLTSLFFPFLPFQCFLAVVAWAVPFECWWFVGVWELFPYACCVETLEIKKDVEPEMFSWVPTVTSV